jgi:zinc protease
MSKIGYREVYVLDLQPSSGQAERLYLDAETYLPVRSNTVLMIGGTPTAVEIYLDDWRNVDGVKYPFFMSQRFSKMTLSYTVKEIKHNEQIDPKLFEP